MNWLDAVEILKDSRNRRVLVLGDVMLDQYLWGTVARASREAFGPHRCKATRRLFARRRGQSGCHRCRARQSIASALMLTPNRSGTFLSAGCLRSGHTVAHAGGCLMESLAIDALLSSREHLGCLHLSGGTGDSAVHLARICACSVTEARDAVIAALAPGVALLCERQPISPIWLGTSRLSTSEPPRLSRRRSYSEVEIAEGIQ
jgi:bifunctional ADP-heptose synthase (sugar kinase/adenylyltransferase)